MDPSVSSGLQSEFLRDDMMYFRLVNGDSGDLWVGLWLGCLSGTLSFQYCQFLYRK